MSHFPYEQMLGARATATANQSLSSNSYQTITFGRTDWDTSNFRPNLDTKMVAPWSGWYHVEATVLWTGTGSGDRIAAVQINGTSNQYGFDVTGGYNTFSGAVVPRNYVRAFVHMNATDYIQLVANPNTQGDTSAADGSTYGAFIQIVLASRD